VLGHSPGILSAFVAMAYPLVGLDGWAEPKIGHRLQELIVMRVNQVLDCEYEWAHHSTAAAAYGIPDTQLDALSDWRTAAAFEDRERAALAIADEVATEGAAGVSLDEGAAVFDPAELVEIVMTASFYCCVAQFVKTFGLVPERERNFEYRFELAT
jgi:alkylhydroperoxidase family enzyme